MWLALKGNSVQRDVSLNAIFFEWGYPFGTPRFTSTNASFKFLATFRFPDYTCLPYVIENVGRQEELILNLFSVLQVAHMIKVFYYQKAK